MRTKDERVCKMCKLFEKNESNEKAKISFSFSGNRSVNICVVFEYLEDWCCGKGAFIFRQLAKQFKLDLVGFDPKNIFISEKYSFNEWDEKGHVVIYCLPFDSNKFHLKNLQDKNCVQYSTCYDHLKNL